MAQVFSCPGGPIINPDNTISCDAWVLVDLPAPDPIHDLTGEEMQDIGGKIILAFTVAFVFRFALKYLQNWSGFGRNGG